MPRDGHLARGASLPDHSRRCLRLRGRRSTPPPAWPAMIARASTLPLTSLLLPALLAHAVLMGSPLAAGQAAPLSLLSSPIAHTFLQPGQTEASAHAHALVKARTFHRGGEAFQLSPSASVGHDTALAGATTVFACPECALGGHPARADDPPSSNHHCHVLIPLASPVALASPEVSLPTSQLPAPGVDASTKGLVTTSTPVEYLAFLRILLV